MQVSKQVSKQVRADTDAVFSSRWWQSSLNIYKIATPDRPPLAAVMLLLSLLLTRKSLECLADG